MELRKELTAIFHEDSLFALGEYYEYLIHEYELARDEYQKLYINPPKMQQPQDIFPPWYRGQLKRAEERLIQCRADLGMWVIQYKKQFDNIILMLREGG